MSHVLYGPDPAYGSARPDLRVHVPSGTLSLRDGTAGGSPITGIDAGIPTAGVRSITEVSGHFEGSSLKAMQREFPEYTRIRQDPSSLGAQLLTAVSTACDDLLARQKEFYRGQYVQTAPLYLQGVVYEWAFGEAQDLDTDPPVSGRLDSTWMSIPITASEDLFWSAPPTRLETTSAEISGLYPIDWIAPSGAQPQTLVPTQADLPLHNTVYLEISGSTDLQYRDVDDRYVPATVELRGRWAHDPYSTDTLRREEIPVLSDGVFASTYAWRSIDRVLVKNFDGTTQIRLHALSFRAPWRFDPVRTAWTEIRTQVPETPAWRLIGASTPFTNVVQTELDSRPSASDPAWLAFCRLQTDTLFDNSVEWDVLDVWKLTDPNGTALSGIVDFVPVPDTPYLLVLDNQSNAWVVETRKPALDMSTFIETQESPVVFTSSWPLSSLETPASFTVRITPRQVRADERIQRWRWILHHAGSAVVLLEDGSTAAIDSTSGWRATSDTIRATDEITWGITGTGQHTFELELVTDAATLYRSYHAFMVTERAALAALPIRGLDAAPTGIDIDVHGRPWVEVAGSAVRLALRTDIGIWDPVDRLLITREPYDEVRR